MSRIVDKPYFTYLSLIHIYKYGDRPYTVAVQNKNQELADYLKALEPEEWHNEHICNMFSTKEKQRWEVYHNI